MSLFSIPTKKQKIIAILDIGSASVGGALVLFRKDGKPIIIYSVRKNIIFQDNLNLERFLSSMLKTLGGVLEQVNKSTKLSPSSFFCVFSSSWSTSITKIMKIEKKESAIITPQEIEELIKKEIDVTSMINKRKKMMEGGHEIIDLKNIQVKLNGYETATPYNKKAKTIEIALFASIGAKKVVDLIKKRIFQIFHTNNVTFGSFSLVEFSAIRDIFTDKKDFIFLDITGEVTEVAIVRNNVLVSTTSFPLGKNFIIRRIISSLNTTREEVVSLLNMHQKGETESSISAKLNSIFLSSEKEWLSFLAKSIIEISGNLVIPRTIFFTVDIEVAEWFKTAISKEEFTEFTSIDKFLDVIILNEKILDKFCLSSPDVYKDPFIEMEAIFASKTM